MKFCLLTLAAILKIECSKVEGKQRNPVVVVDHKKKYQRFYGCGASWTDSAAWIIGGARHNKATDPRELTDEEQRTIFQALFSKEAGIGLDILRQPMGTSDFRWSDYTYEDRKGRFSIANDKAYIIPTVQRSFEENPALKVIALPWSAPAWAKTSQELGGGSLNNEYMTEYFDYFVDFVNAYNHTNIPIWAISVQNEPQHASTHYPTMTMTAKEHGQLITGVRAALDAAHHESVRAVGYDHNWDSPLYVFNTLTSTTSVSAIAFHCYGGNVAVQRFTKWLFPTVEIFLTECTEHGPTDDTTFNQDFRWALEKLVIGAARNWASTVLEWNLVLMEDGSPKSHGGCEDCRGLIDVLYNGGLRKNPAYYALGHLSKFIQADGGDGRATHRIHSSEPTSNTKTLAMLNPDGSSFVIILNNGSPHQTYDIDWSMKLRCTVGVPSWSAVTLFRRSDTETVVEVWRTTDQQHQQRLVVTQQLDCTVVDG